MTRPPVRGIALALPLLAALAGRLDAQNAPAPRDSVTLYVAATTDVHGRLRGWDYDANAVDQRRGLARAATIVDSLRSAHPGRVVLLDAGDLLQGTPLTFVAARQPVDTLHPVVAAMNAMGYDAAAVGNHEFNYGLPVLRRAVGQARFPFLAANAYTVDGRRAFPAWRMIDRQGVRIAIVGATTPGSMVWDRDHLRGRLLMRDVIPEVRRAVEQARAARADVVLVTVHSGLSEPSSYDTVRTRMPSENVTARLAAEVPGIDVVIFGHSHGEVADTTIGGALVVQPKNWATSVAVAQLVLQREGGTWRVRSKRGQTLPVAGRAEHAAVLAATQRAHDATVRFVTAPIGSTPVAWRGDSGRVADVAVTDFVLEVMRRRAGAQLAAGSVFSLDAGFDAGPITVSRLSKLYPYENTLRAVRITGRQLRDYLEFSARYYREGAGDIVDPRIPGYNFDIVAGVDYTLDVSRPIGQRVTRLEYRGRAVAPTDTFTMAVNNYRQTGGGGYAMLSGAPVTYDGGSTEIRQLLIDEVRSRGTIRPEDYHTVNWRLEPARAVERAYGEMRRAQPRAAAPVPAGGRRLRVISINDFHGALEPRPDSRGVRLGGAGAVGAAIERASAECRPECEVVVLDGGDEFQGTPASNLAFGAPVVEVFRRYGVAASALGNHEFDWGQDSLRARMRQAPYRILGANVRDAAGRDVAWIQDDTIIRRGSLRIGVVGIATPLTPSTTKAINVADLRFIDPAPVIDAHAKSLRARGADVVIVVAHEGGFCNRAGDAAPVCEGEIIDVARRVTQRVDAYVSGHTHSPVSTMVGGVPVMQARSSGRTVAVVDLVVGDSGSVPTGLPMLRDVGSDTLPTPAAIEAVVAPALARVAPLIARPVGRVAEDMRRTGSQYGLGNYIADAQRAAAKSDVAVMNNGGIRSDLRAGDATYGTLFEVQPFANVLSRVTVRGSTLRAYFERLLRREQLNAHLSGVRITYDPARPEGQRVVDVTVGGRPLRDDATYTVAMTDFLLTGGDGLGLQKEALRIEPLNIVDLDALIDYVRAAGGVVRPPADERIVPVAR